MPIPSPRAKYDFTNPACYSGTGSTAFDLSGNSYDLTLTNTTFDSVSYAKSLVFTAASSSKAVHLGSLGIDTGDPFTFFMWINATAFTAGGYDVNFSYGQDDQIPLLALRYASLNKFRFESGSSSNTIFPNIDTELNKWHSYCITFDGSVFKLFYDGVLVGSATGTRPIGIPTKLSLGCFDNGGFNSNMKLNYFEAFDQALSDADVLALHYQTEANVLPGLISYIDFLNPASFTNGSTIATDLSGNSEDWNFVNNSYTYNGTYGSLTLPPGCAFRADTQGLFGTGDVSFSLSFWNYFDSSQYDYLYYNGNYPGSGLHIVTDNANSQYKIIYGPFLGLNINTSTVPMNQYNHICYVYDHTTDTSTVYVNDINVLSFVYTLNQGVSGGYPGVQFNDIWNGTGASPIALIYCFDRALSAGEVDVLYDKDYARFYGPPTPPVYAGKVAGRIFGEGFNG